MSPADERGAALELLGDARVTMIIGASDAGKTTLVTELASRLAAGGAAVGVVDADLGQSEIGPPTTVSLGRVRGRIARLSEAPLVALHFVGVSSPPRDLRGAVEGARRMADRARAEGFERVLVDTSGLVAGGLGAALKGRKIAAVDPDLLLVLERADECRAIVRPFEGADRPRVVRLAARGRPRRRTVTARRAHRVAALECYLVSARRFTFDLSRLTADTPSGMALETCVDVLCGIDDVRGETLALGVVVDVAGNRLGVLTPLSAGAEAAHIRLGRERRDGTPLAPARRSSTPGGDGREGAR